MPDNEPTTWELYRMMERTREDVVSRLDRMEEGFKSLVRYDTFEAHIKAANTRIQGVEHGLGEEKRARQDDRRTAFKVYATAAFTFAIAVVGFILQVALGNA